MAKAPLPDWFDQTRHTHQPALASAGHLASLRRKLLPFQEPSMPKVQAYAPPACIYGPWVTLHGTAVFSVGNKPHSLSVSISPLGDGCTLQGQVQYYHPTRGRTTDVFMDSTRITRDGGSLAQVKVRVKNLSPLGTVVDVFY